MITKDTFKRIDDQPAVFTGQDYYDGICYFVNAGRQDIALDIALCAIAHTAFDQKQTTYRHAAGQAFERIDTAVKGDFGTLITVRAAAVWGLAAIRQNDPHAIEGGAMRLQVFLKSPALRAA